MPIRTISIFQQAPFLRIFIAFAGGILLEWYNPLPFNFLLYSGIAILLFIFIHTFFPLPVKFVIAPLTGLLYNFLIVLAGMVVIQLQPVRTEKHMVNEFSGNKQITLVTVASDVINNIHYYKIIGEINGIYDDHSFKEYHNKILIYLKKDSSGLPLAFGDRMLIKKSISLVSYSGNPGAFNFREFYLFKGIRFQTTISDNDYILIPGKKINPFKDFISSMVSSILKIISGAIKPSEERGVAEALLIGYKDDLSKELIQSYTNTGVIHIIAISGMHLSLVYMIITLILVPLKKIKWLSIPLTLIGIWLFVFITGSQPSILRAAVMLTCIITGKLISRKGSTINSLAVSAFILLWYNPFWLWDIGFQLSYAAVLSIIIFYKPVAAIVQFNNKILIYIWKLLAVTLSAQPLTIPICVYHFHQFPLLFLLTNLIAIPLSGIILMLEIFLCLFSFLPALSHFTGTIIYYGIRFMDGYISRFQKVSFVLWKDVYLTITECHLLYLVIIIIFKSIQGKKRSVWKLLVVPVSAFVIIRNIDNFSALQQNKLIVFNLPHQQLTGIIHGRNGNFITPVSNSDLIRTYIKQAGLQMNMINYSISQNTQLEVNHKNIIIVDTSIYLRATVPKLILDYLIVSGKCSFDLNDLATKTYLKYVIFDATVPPWKMKSLSQNLDSLKIPYYDIRSQGAYITDL
jgi:competence protein ComEC